MQVAFGDVTVTRARVSERLCRFKEERTSVESDDRPCRHLTGRNI
jgi:hypothetical protein